MLDLVKYIKDLEKEFLLQNQELYVSDRIGYLRKREEFVTGKLGERKEGEKNGES